MKKLLLLAACSFLVWSSCIVKQPEENKLLELVGTVAISPAQDTVFLAASPGTYEQKSFRLFGNVVNKTEKTISNTGAITSAQYVVTTIDTVLKQLNSADAEWKVSNANVISAYKGTVTAKSPGTSLLWAIYNGVSSPSILVVVRVVDAAPGLSLDPPDLVLTFQNSVTVSGTVQTLFSGTKLKVDEASSGFNQSNIAYDSDGRFSVTVAGIQPGFRTINVTATHPTRADLLTKKVKYVYYYPLFSAEADSITGHWIGHTLGRDFDFYVTKNAILPRYDISGTVDIEFGGYGLIQGIQLPGVVNGDGTMSASLSQSYQGADISGTLVGVFRSTGKAEGAMTAKMNKPGWIELSAKLAWTADKAK